MRHTAILSHFMGYFEGIPPTGYFTLRLKRRVKCCCNTQPSIMCPSYPQLPAGNWPISSHIYHICWLNVVVCLYNHPTVEYVHWLNRSPQLSPSNRSPLLKQNGPPRSEGGEINQSWCPLVPLQMEVARNDRALVISGDLMVIIHGDSCTDSWWFMDCYPLVNQHSYCKWPFTVNLPIKKWWFSMVRLVYQRVNLFV